MPQPRTAIVRPVPISAPRCAAASIPRARPLTIVTPHPAKSFAISSVMSFPDGVARRPPTIATATSSFGDKLPLTYNNGGGSEMVLSRAGYDRSNKVTVWILKRSTIFTWRSICRRILDSGPRRTDSANSGLQPALIKSSLVAPSTASGDPNA